MSKRTPIEEMDKAVNALFICVDEKIAADFKIRWSAVKSHIQERLKDVLGFNLIEEIHIQNRFLLEHNKDLLVYNTTLRESFEAKTQEFEEARIDNNNLKDKNSKLKEEVRKLREDIAVNGFNDSEVERVTKLYQDQFDRTKRAEKEIFELKNKLVKTIEALDACHGVMMQPSIGEIKEFVEEIEQANRLYHEARVVEGSPSITDGAATQASPQAEAGPGFSEEDLKCGRIFRKPLKPGGRKREALENIKYSKTPAALKKEFGENYLQALENAYENIQMIAAKSLK